jgi:methylthioribulose-1-phosphate dehydratase
MHIFIHFLVFQFSLSLRDKAFIAPSGVQKERILPEHIFVLPYPQHQPQPESPTATATAIATAIATATATATATTTACSRHWNFLRKPTQPLKESACTPLFWEAFDLRDAGACIHTHSQHAVMATLLWPGREWRVSGLEMIKGVRWGGVRNAMSYLDELVVPIIENTPDEEDLRDTMAEVRGTTAYDVDKRKRFDGSIRIPNRL